ncbi:RICIN domain-containing protein [Streptomyces sp. NRRL B-3648]|uniref:RICIN domain-containing protein n=1 Tax=Streptomyces sp. NRRL B-3648 TaxID=1519493 RepID=UPI001F39032B|nr:RICIN domain-containing protein [Streptomyces sp. NRRL B-3648]
MQSPYPPRPPHPPLPGPAREPDRALLARLNGPEDGRHHAVALLLARHWPATRDYAVVCLTAAGPTAQLVATAAFHHVLGRMPSAVTGGALRPHLLAAVRDTVRAWAADDVACIALTELRKTTGGRGLRATKPGPPENRQLAARAFRALPGAAQCLLWHTEVEAEPINIPAGLLGLDPADAMTALERAREQFRAGCVRAHRELAPTRECRFYNRLLDVPIRRGGTLLPDVRRHLTVCRHCRHAAEQLGHFDGALPLLLAETVLGWGARRYLDSRPGRGAPGQWPPPPPQAPPAAPPVSGGRHRTGPASRHRKAVAIGVAVTSLALLATVLVDRGWSDDNGVPGPAATWGAPAGKSPRPSGTGARPAPSPATASAAGPAAPAHGTLRALSSGRCLTLRGERVEAGAGVRLGLCTAAPAQQWSYQGDGLLRSAADPRLCLAADPGTKRIALAGCAVPAGEVSYDLTVRGEILPRRHHWLALAAGSGRSGARVEVAERDGSARQRWVLEPAAAGGRPRSDAVPDAATGHPRSGAGRPEPSAGGTGRSPRREREGGGTSRGEPEPTGERGAPRVARIRATGAGRPAAGTGAVHRADDLVAPVVGTLAEPVVDTLTEPVAGDGGAAAAAVRAVLG